MNLLQMSTLKALHDLILKEENILFYAQVSRLGSTVRFEAGMAA